MSPLIITILVIGLVGALALTAVGAFLAFRPEPSSVQERLGRYADVGVIPEENKQDKPKERGSPLGQRLNEFMQRRGLGEKTRIWLARSNLKVNVGEFYASALIAIIAGGLFGMFGTIVPDCLGVSGGFFPCLYRQSSSLQALIVTVIGGVLGAIAPRFYVNLLIGQRRRKFEDQLADALSLMVNGIRAGYSVIQAMEAVSRELPPPISEEFRRLVQENQLGVPIEDALAHMLQRIDSADLDLTVTAIAIQREVGGNLAEILEVIAYTIRERVRIKGEITTLTAQGMMTGSVISLLPLILMAILYFVSRKFIMMFFLPENQPLGFIMLGIAGFLIIIGWLIVRKVVTIEI